MDYIPVLAFVWEHDCVQAKLSPPDVSDLASAKWSIAVRPRPGFRLPARPSMPAYLQSCCNLLPFQAIAAGRGLSSSSSMGHSHTCYVVSHRIIFPSAFLPYTICRILSVR